MTTPPTYNFRYSAITYGRIYDVPTIVNGGYYGAYGTNGFITDGNATKDTDTQRIYTEISNLLDFKNNVLNTFPTGNELPDPGGIRTFLPYPNWYTLSSNDGEITFQANKPSDHFYISIVSATPFNIVFTLSRFAQAMNIYIWVNDLQNLEVSTGDSYPIYGNIIADSVTEDTKSTVIGSISSLSGQGITIHKLRFASPQYIFLFAALTRGELANTKTIGGLVGYDTIYNSDISKSTLTDPTNELVVIEDFRSGILPFLRAVDSVGDLVYNETPISNTSGTIDIKPISLNTWYSVGSILTENIVFNFDTTDPDDIFYIYSESVLDLRTVTMQINGNTNPFNIYIVSDADDGLTSPGLLLPSTQTLLYGNFICRTGTVNGFANTLYGTLTSYTYINDNTNPRLTIHFTYECFMKGTKILTDQWYVPVEELKVGDLVITHGEIRDKDHVVDVDTPMPIIRVHKHKCVATMKTSPVVIVKNTFAPNKPFEDLYVSKKHGLINRKGKLHPANNYVNGNTIYQDPTIDLITYYHIELASHYAITANGVMAESYNTPPRLRPICAPPNAPR